MSVLVVTGAGGMGLAIARRLGTGRHTLLADVHADRADEVADLLRSDGHAVTSARADVSDASSVEALVKSAGELGPLGAVVHTAGVSPIQADAETIMAVDLVGTARVLDRFETIATNGSVAVVIASMAGHYWPELDDADHRQLATSPADELVSVSIVARAASGGRAAAYALAKRANQVRVQHAALRWASRGGRCVSVSPGIISTPMGQQELAGFGGDVMRSMIDRSPARRIGTPDDIAAAVEFLVSPAASFITGTDLLVDGGVVASTKAAGSP